MKRCFVAFSAIAVAAVAALWWDPVGAVAQGAQGPSGSGASVSTPRTADGHPDVSGLWMGGGRNDERFVGNFRAGTERPPVDEQGNITVNIRGRDGSIVNFERDNSLTTRSDPNKPLYKPEFWDKVQQLDENRNLEDPGYGCLPAGLPRMGAPTKIVQSPTELIFLYQSGGERSFRVIPMDGRPLPPPETWEGGWLGQSVGHWEGDTLVIETVDFNDTSWLALPGYFHSEDMRVIERMHREGNTLTWQATVEDPTVLMKPWGLTPITLRPNPDPKASIAEGLPCSERDLSHLVTKEHH